MSGLVNRFGVGGCCCIGPPPPSPYGSYPYGYYQADGPCCCDVPVRIFTFGQWDDEQCSLPLQIIPCNQAGPIAVKWSALSGLEIICQRFASSCELVSGVYVNNTKHYGCAERTLTVERCQSNGSEQCPNCSRSYSIHVLIECDSQWDPATQQITAHAFTVNVWVHCADPGGCPNPCSPQHDCGDFLFGSGFIPTYVFQCSTGGPSYDPPSRCRCDGATWTFDPPLGDILHGGRIE